jgi:uncharacterized protein YlxP (DUF503 family)
MAEQAHVAVLMVEILIPASQSLKEKRRVLKSIKDRIRAKFNVSVAEIGEHDKWQRAVLGVTAISPDKNYLMGQVEAVISLVDSVDGAQLIRQDLQFR